MRKKQVKKLKKIAAALALMKPGGNAKKEYKTLKQIHNSLPHYEKK